MSIGMSDKNKTERKKINTHITEFLNNGGKITHLPYGVPKAQKFTFNNKRPTATTK
jgi:hypothetical protein